MIAVSGSGVAGLAATLACVRNKKQVLFVAGTKSAIVQRGGVQIAPNGWAALDQLGVANKAKKLSTDLNAIYVRDIKTGSTMANLDLSAVNYASISRFDLTSLLETEISRNGGAKRIDARITHVTQTNKSRKKTLEIIINSDSSHEIDALISADGLRGFGRQYIHGLEHNRNLLRDTERVALRAVVNASDLPRFFSQPFCNLWLGNGVHFVHYPINGGEDINLVLTLDASCVYEGWEQRYFKASSILSELFTHDILEWKKTKLPNLTYHDCWRRGRVVLAGDAAHPIPPNLAQGAGQSLVDGACLMRWLENENIDNALSGYAKERSQAVSSIFKKAELTSRVMAMKGPAAKARSLLINLGGANMLNEWLKEVWATT